MIHMEFRDTKFMSAGEKDQAMRHWDRFVRSGFDRECFTDRLYNHLIQHCSFIAHYDRNGFYSVYFEDKKNTIRFIDQFTTGKSAEYGYDLWLHGDYDDINPAMCEVMMGYAPGLRKKLEDSMKREDISQAKSLLTRHGIEFNWDGD